MEQGSLIINDIGHSNPDDAMVGLYLVMIGALVFYILNQTFDRFDMSLLFDNPNNKRNYLSDSDSESSSDSEEEAEDAQEAVDVPEVTPGWFDWLSWKSTDKSINSDSFVEIASSD